MRPNHFVVEFIFCVCFVSRSISLTALCSFANSHHTNTHTCRRYTSIHFDHLSFLCVRGFVVGIVRRRWLPALLGIIVFIFLLFFSRASRHILSLSLTLALSLSLPISSIPQCSFTCRFMCWILLRLQANMCVCVFNNCPCSVHDVEHTVTVFKIYNNIKNWTKLDCLCSIAKSSPNRIYWVTYIQYACYVLICTALKSIYCVSIIESFVLPVTFSLSLFLSLNLSVCPIDTERHGRFWICLAFVSSSSKWI